MLTAISPMASAVQALTTLSGANADTAAISTRGAGVSSTPFPS